MAVGLKCKIKYNGLSSPKHLIYHSALSSRHEFLSVTTVLSASSQKNVMASEADHEPVYDSERMSRG